MSNEFQEAVRRISGREREVLGHLVHGDTYGEIARRMNVSPHTVDTYLRRIRAKTGARSRMHLLLLALSAEGSSAHTLEDTGLMEAPRLPGRPEPSGESRI
ncbi:helix-turn-helix transcriptional regulator [Streptomyces sp. SID10853]|uniref:LuxR C-terminal-related transcriptional regulator n=1 Tax=Streptomyces sp. SID10853 TaxID=2706028 RepID=UPI0013BF393A|nr:helix-turn-helix transcriptional regulator [Streptomyces sp. SID10853]